jgi:hypothetical protein
MRISRDLNLVLPVDTSVGTVFVHSTPISRAVFEQYWKVLAKASAALVKDGSGAITGPAVALLQLKESAQEVRASDGRSTMWDAPDGVEMGLLPEIRRLTNVLTPASGSGWQMVPFQECVSRKEVLSPDDVYQIENVLTFFIATWWTVPPGAREAILNLMASLRGGAITSRTCTECIDSLQTSKGDESTGETAGELWLKSLTGSAGMDSSSMHSDTGTAGVPLPSSATATSLPH